MYLVCVSLNGYHAHDTNARTCYKTPFSWHVVFKAVQRTHRDCGIFGGRRTRRVFLIHGFHLFSETRLELSRVLFSMFSMPKPLKSIPSDRR